MQDCLKNNLKYFQLLRQTTMEKDADTGTAIKALTLSLCLMNNKAKAATGLSIMAVLLWIFHVFQVINFVSSNDPTPGVKPSDGVIILTDPAGKKDTIPLKDYLDSLKKTK